LIAAGKVRINIDATYPAGGDRQGAAAQSGRQHSRESGRRRRPVTS
jgi:hypothetical protein